MSSTTDVRDWRPGDREEFWFWTRLGSGPDWVPGTIAQTLGPLTYIVDVSEGRV